MSVMETFRIAQKLLTVNVILFLAPGCAYRFTNRHVRAPDGVRSVFVEAVYDTSEEVVPHELLWDALQKAIARDGHLRLTTADKADAIVLTHLTTAGVGPTGSITVETITKDPNTRNPESANPSEFRDIRRAGEHTTQERINLGVQVEVIDLRTRKKLMSRSYSRSAKFKSARAGFRADGYYLVYEEAMRHQFELMSQSIANAVVEDLLVRR